MHLQELASQLSIISRIKEELSVSLRGWVSALGLHIQERQAGQLSRLQAGGKYRSYFDAWYQDGEYRVRKFDWVTWDRRFALVVNPSLDIVTFLANWNQVGLHLEALAKLREAVLDYERTGEWPELPRVTEQLRAQKERQEQSLIVEERRRAMLHQIRDIESRPTARPIVDHARPFIISGIEPIILQ